MVALILCLGPAPWTMAAEITILKSSDIGYYDEAVQGFRSALPPRTTIKEYSLGGSVARGRELGKTLRASPPDLVFAVGLKAAMAAKLEILDTPVVFCLVLNPESHGLPTANMTGILMKVPVERQLQAIRSLLPDSRRIGLLYDEDKSGPFVAEARRLASQQRLDLLAVPVHAREEVPSALRSLLPKVQGLWLIQDQTVVTESSIPFLLQTTLDAKVPLIAFSSTLVQQGALGGLVVNAWEVGQQAGRVTGAKLRGDSVPGRPLIEPERAQLALNLHTAEYLGLTPSADVLRLATVLYGSGAVAKTQKLDDVIP
ncbi:MAG: ABC transporter substrate-binding protein [Nitrospirae bacterium]|nr:ABC transporter substrate-binding protein [Nitrospirota bacterium]